VIISVEIFFWLQYEAVFYYRQPPELKAAGSNPAGRTK